MPTFNPYLNASIYLALVVATCAAISSIISLAHAFPRTDQRAVTRGPFRRRCSPSPIAPNLSMTPIHVVAHVTSQTLRNRSVRLYASRNRQKIASRTKWAESRGLSSSSSDDGSDSVGNAPKLIISGAPASGKGTQCEFIKAKYGVVHLSTGDMLRAAVAAGTDVGKEAKDYMDSGKLVPDEVIIGVVSQHDVVMMSSCSFKVKGVSKVPAKKGRNLRDASIVHFKFACPTPPLLVCFHHASGQRSPRRRRLRHLRLAP